MQLDLRSRSQASAPKLPTMSPAAYEAARATWHARMTNEYNSQPQPGLDRLDNTFYTSIVLTLK